MHNNADHNTLTAFLNSVPNLVRILEQELNVATDWLEKNQMIANPDKFHAVLVTKGRDDTTGEKLMIQGEQIQSENAVRLLGVKIYRSLKVISSLLRYFHICDFQARGFQFCKGKLKISFATYRNHSLNSVFHSNFSKMARNQNGLELAET